MTCEQIRKLYERLPKLPPNDRERALLHLKAALLDLCFANTIPDDPTCLEVMEALYPTEGKAANDG